MKIELEATLVDTFKNGINLFTGAGFSVLAKDKTGKSLPLGLELKNELAEKFNQPNSLDLAQLCTIIEAITPEKLKKYLTERFEVIEYDRKYDVLKTINIKSIFTTNIDNLIVKIFSNSEDHYLNDITNIGPSFSDRTAIDYIPLHGSILDQERKLIFTSIDLATTFNSEQSTWMYLRQKISKYPTIFVGYSLADASVIQALYSNENKIKAHNTKWILLYNDDPASVTYFKTLGFNIIRGSVKELLDYFQNLTIEAKYSEESIFNDPKVVFPHELIPERSAKLPVRPLKYFFLGAEPFWSDIYNNRIPQTSHYKETVDRILGNKNVIVLGIPASGKTTLLMQIAAQINFSGIKLICSNMTYEKAVLTTGRLNEDKALVFMDNFSDNIASFNHFSSFPNIKLIGFDRHYNYEIVSHHIDHNSFEFYDVTPLSPSDIQLLYSRIPDDIRKTKITRELREKIDPSIFDFINLNTTFPNINRRYKHVIIELEKNSVDLCDLLIMMCYVNACRTVVSFDMALGFLNDTIETYQEVYACINKLEEIIIDYDGPFITDDQDYFTPRSSIISDAILNQVPQSTFRRVFIRFHKNVSPLSIPRFDIFKKYGYDSNFAKKAFPNWKDGKMFFESIFESDNSPFTLQQGALYLASKRKFQEAFNWIDEAILISKNKFFSIRNSHAIILFEANIDSDDDGEDVRNSLDESMKILENCYGDDKRKLYHALTYSRQALKYFAKYGDEKSITYLKVSKKWLTEELKLTHWNNDIRRLLKQIEPLI